MAVVIDELAVRHIGNPAYESEWRRLHANCPWATVFQSFDFVSIWYRVYHEYFLPLLIHDLSSEGRLAVLLPLAIEKRSGRIVVAGAQQAEYQVCITEPELGDRFIPQALDLIGESFPNQNLRFKYLPRGTPLQWLNGHRKWARCHERRSIQRPVIDLRDHERLATSLRKKSNKSRLNRLRRLGKIALCKLGNPAEFSRVLDEIADYYDLRQGAVNGVLPFLEDPLKKAFLVELMGVPGLLHVSTMMVGQAIVAAQVGVCDDGSVVVGLFSYSPFFAKHSPGKILIHLLAQDLAQQGYRYFDLTPGGDWKQRFATDCDEVAEVTFFMNRQEAVRSRAVGLVDAAAKRCLGFFGVQPAAVKAVVGRVRNVTLAKLLRWLATYTWDEREFRVYAMDAERAARLTGSETMARDKVSDLLRFRPTETTETRRAFLSNALLGLGQGVHSYTLIERDLLVHVGWMIERQRKSHFSEVEQDFIFPPDCAVLYDAYTDPSARGRGLHQESIRQRLNSAARTQNTKKIFTCVLADNGPSRHVIEKMGFGYVCSLFQQRRFGRVRRWSSMDSAPSGTNAEKPEPNKQ